MMIKRTTCGRVVPIVTAMMIISAAAMGNAGSYYNGISTSNSTFVTDLHNLIYPHTKLTYYTTAVADYVSRDTSSGQKVVTCVYSGQNYVYTPPFAWGTFSREHTWCHSWMPTYTSESGPEYSDQHHLFPTNQNNANGIRSNHPLGTVVTVISTYLEAKFGKDANDKYIYEPRTAQKGDAARALFYMAVCYNGVNGNNWTFANLNNVTLPALSEAPIDVTLLKQWNQLDPPDAAEVTRNDSVQKYQGNRNPFVDHPEWVNWINFNTVSKSAPTEAAEPTNHVTNFVVSGTTTSSLTLNWTAAVPGSQAPSGYLLLIYATNDYIIPVDEATYADDTDLSDGRGRVNITDGNTTTYTFNGLSNSQTYYFRIYSFNGTGALRNYKTDESIPFASAATGSSSLADEPTNYPSGFNTPTITASTITIQWTDATGAVLPTGYIIFANKTNVFSDPFDGATYANDTNLADGSAIVHVAFSDPDQYTFTGLDSATTYSFRLYPYNGDGSSRNYKTASFPQTLTAMYTTLGSGSSNPAVVVNEYFNGGSGVSEWVELLVTSNLIDLRGMKLRDYSSAGNVSTNPLIFSTNSLWASVQQGTFIVIYSAGTGAPTDDFDLADKKVVIGAANTTYFSGGVFAIAGTADAVEMLSANSTHIHALSHGSKPGAIDSIPAPKANVTGPSTSGNVVRFVKTTAVSHFSQDTCVEHSTTATIGAPNDNAQQQLLNTVLPVELESFYALPYCDSVVLAWSTATELNNYGFEIERLIEGESDWKKIGFVAGNGVSFRNNDYHFVDRGRRFSSYLYRLKQLDIGGVFEYTSTISVNAPCSIPDLGILQSFPNPFNAIATITFAVAHQGEVTIRIKNLLGQDIKTLWQGPVEAMVTHSVRFDAANYSTGIYFCELQHQGGIQLSRLILVK